MSERRALRRGTLRVWLDELERLPEYTFTRPTGVCAGKTWRFRDHEGRWFVEQYQPRDHETHWVMCFDVVLLHGPRRGNESLRFKVSCGGRHGG